MCCPAERPFFVTVFVRTEAHGDELERHLDQSTESTESTEADVTTSGLTRMPC